MRGPDGTVYPMGGEYREITEPERIVFTAGALDAEGKMMFEILNTVTFEEMGGKTRLTLRTELLHSTPEATERYLSGQRAGWSQSLVRFGELLNRAEEQPAPPNEMVLSRVFDAPRETVWEAMADPEQVVEWWGPVGFTTTVEAMDLRPGGVWQLTMHGPDGANYQNRSVFTEVVKPERIAYALGGRKEGGGGPEAEFHATWTFDALEDGRTRLTLRFVFPTAEKRDEIARFYGALEGGKQTLGRLGERIAFTPLVIERVFDAPIEAVWQALTDKERVKEWYFEIPDFAATPGHEFGFSVEHEGANYVHLCRVTEVIPGRKLAYTWRYEGQEGDSLVTWELAPEAGGAGDRTRLRLTHDGLESFPALPDYARRNFVRGWTFILGQGLGGYLGG
jgi:uncharacterized protein YndB with AHSA1/START domain